MCIKKSHSIQFTTAGKILVTQCSYILLPTSAFITIFTTSTILCAMVTIKLVIIEQQAPHSHRLLSLPDCSFDMNNEMEKYFKLLESLHKCDMPEPKMNKGS